MAKDIGGRTGYELWIETEGVPIVEGYGVEDVVEVPRRPWARVGGSGAYIQLKGMEGVTGMYVSEIPPGGALNPERHLYEEVIYVYKGRGSTEVWREGERKQVFEWGEGSLFAPPLNTWHRLVNGGREPVILVAVTTAPLVMDIFRDPEFVFNTGHRFEDRYSGQEGYFKVSDERRTVGRHHLWETNFIPDVATAALDDGRLKVAGGQITAFEMAGNGLIGHISDWPAGIYHKAHYHGAGAVLLILRSTGYLLMWPKDIGTRPYQAGRESEVVEFHWKPGSLYSPPSGWFHQHLNTGREPARQLALRVGSYRFPLGVQLAAKRGLDGPITRLQEGGTLIDYEYEDPEIRRRFELTLQREGVECRMPAVAYAR